MVSFSVFIISSDLLTFSLNASVQVIFCDSSVSRTLILTKCRSSLKNEKNVSLRKLNDISRLLQELGFGEELFEGYCALVHYGKTTVVSDFQHDLKKLYIFKNLPLKSQICTRKEL